MILKAAVLKNTAAFCVLGLVNFGFENLWQLYNECR